MVLLPVDSVNWRVPAETAPVSDTYSTTRMLCSALILPTIATVVGKLMFGTVHSNFQRTLLVSFQFLSSLRINPISYFIFIHCCVDCCGLQISHVSLSFPLISLSGRIVLSHSSLLDRRPMLVCLYRIMSRVLMQCGRKICTILNNVSQNATTWLLAMYTILPVSPKIGETMIVYCMICKYVIQICVLVILHLLAITCVLHHDDANV